MTPFIHETFYSIRGTIYNIDIYRFVIYHEGTIFFIDRSYHKCLFIIAVPEDFLEINDYVCLSIFYSAKSFLFFTKCYFLIINLQFGSMLHVQKAKHVLLLYALSKLISSPFLIVCLTT